MSFRAKRSLAWNPALKSYNSKNYSNVIVVKVQKFGSRKGIIRKT